MATRAWIGIALVLAFGVALGVGFDRGWNHVAPALSAQQEAAPAAARGQGGQGRRAAPLPTMESLPMEVAQLKALVPSNSHIMMDVQFHWTNLYFAGRRRNWPLAQYLRL